MSAGPRFVFVPGDRRVLERVSAHLATGGLLAYPTETVYGVGGVARLEQVWQVRDLKGSTDRGPFLLLIPDIEAVELTWTPAARKLAEVFWPGPLTLILKDEEERFPDGIRSPDGGVAVRVSPHPFLRGLSRVWPHPLLSTSANLAGEAPPSRPDEVERAFTGRPGAGRLRVVDGGVLPPSKPSTLLDCMAADPRVLREGAVPLDALRRLIPRLNEPS